MSEQKESDVQRVRLVKKLEYLEGQCRRQYHKVHNIAKTANEVLVAKFNDVAKNLDVVEVPPRDLGDIYWLPTRADKVLETFVS